MEVGLLRNALYAIRFDISLLKEEVFGKIPDPVPSIPPPPTTKKIADKNCKDCEFIYENLLMRSLNSKIN